MYIYWRRQLKNVSLTQVCNQVRVSTSGTMTYSSPGRESRAWSPQTGALSSHYSSVTCWKNSGILASNCTSRLDKRETKEVAGQGKLEVESRPEPPGYCHPLTFLLHSHW